MFGPAEPGSSATSSEIVLIMVVCLKAENRMGGSNNVASKQLLADYERIYVNRVIESKACQSLGLDTAGKPKHTRFRWELESKSELRSNQCRGLRVIRRQRL